MPTVQLTEKKLASLKKAAKENGVSYAQLLNAAKQGKEDAFWKTANTNRANDAYNKAHSQKMAEEKKKYSNKGKGTYGGK